MPESIFVFPNKVSCKLVLLHIFEAALAVKNFFCCTCLSCSFHSGSRLGGLITVMCFFFNHGEVGLPQFFIFIYFFFKTKISFSWRQRCCLSNWGWTEKVNTKGIRLYWKQNTLQTSMYHCPMCHLRLKTKQTKKNQQSKYIVKWFWDWNLSRTVSSSFKTSRSVFVCVPDITGLDVPCE